jgi:hypothetical protein
MTPMQEASLANINTGASAFGMAAPTSSGMPEAQTFAGGVRGYSSAPMYEAAISELKARYPGQYNALMAAFIDPVTGAAPQGVYGSAPQPQPQAGMQDVVSPATGVGSNRSDRSAAEIAALAPASSGGGGGYGSNGFASTPLAARLPGGVNDPNLTNPLNQIIAKITQTTPRAPTQADRPVSRPSSTTSSGTRSGGSFRGGR